MKKRLFFFPVLLALAFISLSLASPASAQNVDATDPDVILSVARGFGDATLGTDSQGDPQIKGRMEGTSYVVFFYGCNDSGKQCGEIQFYAGWTGQNVTRDRLNEWNRDTRYAKAYIDRDGDPVIEYDANLKFGVSRKNLEDTFDWWRVVMGEFRKSVLR